MFKGGKPAQRYIPGQAIPGAPPPGAPPGSQGSSGKEDKKKRVRSKRPLKEAGVDGGATPDNVNGAATPADVDEQVGKLQIGENTSAVDEAVVKKIRNLTKKLKAIEELKERVNKGEVLEKTQLQKIESEAGIKAEIESLGGSGVV